MKMKRIGCSTIMCQILLAFIMLTVSCADFDCAELARVWKVFHASIDGDKTRSSIDQNGVISWTKDDRISIFQGPGVNERYRFTGKTGDYDGDFVKDDELEPGIGFSTYYAIYPYAESTSCSEEGVFSFEFPYEQTYYGTTFDAAAAVMTAVGPNFSGADLKFSNACGFLRIKAYCATSVYIKSITVSGNDGELIAGNASITISKSAAPTISINDGGKTQIRLNCRRQAIATTRETATEFWLALPPVTFAKGLTISMEDIDGHVFQKTTDKTIAIIRNKVKTMSAFQFSPVISRINGTDIIMGNNLVGLVYDSDTIEGIEGVPVTDGYSYTYTDKNGVYQMVGHSGCRRVYYSLPSEYMTIVDSGNNPLFFSNTEPNLQAVNRNDFRLTRKTKDETNFTLIGMGDPQPSNSSDVNRFKNETLADIRKVMDSGSYKNVYIQTLGDLTNNNREMIPSSKAMMSNFTLNDGSCVPFYKCIGNHDHLEGPTVVEAPRLYVDYFGPYDYSYNIGDAHIVVMNDILCAGWGGYSWSYQVGLTDDQWAWLQADLATVRNPENKLVIFAAHSPIHSGASTSPYFRKDKHYDDLMNALSSFNEAHIFAGHSHTNYNYVHTEYVTRSGLPVYEHIHSTAGGEIWACNITVDGAPNGYTIYSIRGNSIYDWVEKGSNFPIEYQFRVYDGNQEMHDKSGNTYHWYNPSNKCGSGSQVARGDVNLKNAFVANLWTGDDYYWTVELFQNGHKVGNLEKVPNPLAWDVFVASFYFTEIGSANFSQYNGAPFHHYWYIKTPHGGAASAETDWEIRATQTIPGSGVKHVYKCSTLTTEYTGFK